MNHVAKLKVGETFRLVRDPRNKGRGVWFSPEVVWKKTGEQEVEAVSLGKTDVATFAGSRVSKDLREFNHAGIELVEASQETERLIHAEQLEVFHVERAKAGEPILCWIPDRVNKHDGHFERVYFVGVTRNGFIAIQYQGNTTVSTVDPDMLRMAQRPLTLEEKQ